MAHRKLPRSRDLGRKSCRTDWPSAVPPPAPSFDTCDLQSADTTDTKPLIARRVPSHGPGSWAVLKPLLRIPLGVGH